VVSSTLDIFFSLFAHDNDTVPKKIGDDDLLKGWDGGGRQLEKLNSNIV